MYVHFKPLNNSVEFVCKQFVIPDFPDNIFGCFFRSRRRIK